ncbi:putative oxidoreductase EphD [Myxococcaceae bacterium]|jgi:NAD(P)-dependent dehydrogenase (short-subunit alcohol dehydrogenase family)|nr:putative oxidoreductase EphD [Myxococcaceae bacterium]
MMETKNLEGRSVLVSGAASGIGRALALECARRGARLVICDVNEKGLGEVETAVREMGREVLARRVDVAKESDWRELATLVHADRECVDLLVNNAGVGLGGGLLDTTIEDWDWILGINLRGVVLGCHFFVPRMVERKRGGHVVNVASMAALAPSETLVAYSTTKSAVLGFSEALADELQWHGIGVTGVCPGFIDTPIVASSVLRGPSASDEARAQAQAFYRKRGYTAERTAINILKAVARGRIVAPISPESWFAFGLRRASPSALRYLMRRMGERLRRELAAPR